MPSAARFVAASGLCVNSRSAIRSVRTRLISSGIVQSNERRPASTWATGMPSLAAARVAASVELTSPPTHDEVGRSSSRSALERLQHARRLRAVRSRADAQEDVGLGEPEVREHLGRQALVVVLPGVDDPLGDVGALRQRRDDGAILTKFGRAPTTWTTHPDVIGP